MVSENLQTCLSNIVCANSTFIAIYGVIFTIVISLGVYIYGLQNKSEKITLTKKTNIRSIIGSGLFFFVISFFKLPSPSYEAVNFVLVGVLIIKIWMAFWEVIKFNENELSGERAVREFKESVIKEKLIAFEELKLKNDNLNKILQDKKVERFVMDDENDSYYLIRSQKAGYITNVNIQILFSQETPTDTSELKDSPYYVPYNIASGGKIDFDDIILGIKKDKEDIVGKSEKLRSYISITDEFDNPQSYIEAELRSYYPEMFSLITLGNAKGLELKLEEFSKLVNLIKKTNSFSEIIQFINDDIILPLQKYAFKNGDVDTIRKIVSFSISYLYESISQKLSKTYNIFLRNLSSAFYESSKMRDDSSRESFHEIYFRWLSELAKYSIKPKLKKNDLSYTEYAVTFLSTINGMLKIAFDIHDPKLFSETLSFLNDSFTRDSYEHEELAVFEDVITTKKAVILGFTSWVYKYYPQRKENFFYQNALAELFSTLSKERYYHYSHNPDELNYYLSIYLKASEISDKSNFSWETWGMPEGEVYTITVRSDLKNLLIDQLIALSIKNPDLRIEIKGKNYNDELAIIKEGSEFDPFKNKTKDSFSSSTKLTKEQFADIKTKVYSILRNITEKYEEDVRINLIEQPLDETKFQNFGKENMESYAKARVMFRVGKFVKNLIKRDYGFGYSILLHKEQFVARTNIHYTNDDQFGENLARSEDNRILESIYKKLGKTIKIKKEEVGKTISAKKDLAAIVLWIDNYFNLEDTDRDNFKPYWQEPNSKLDKGAYYQGSINGVDVYIVYKFQEHKSYPDTLFLFSDEALSIEEFDLEIPTVDDQINVKIFDTKDISIHLSVTNLSDLENERRKIVEKWILDGIEQEANKEAKIIDLRTKVDFKLFKGINIENLKIDRRKVKIFELE